MTKCEALEKTIYNVENNVYEYNWWYYDSCNCGVVARTILGKLPSDCGTHTVEVGLCVGFAGTFDNTIKKCETSGIPIPEVYKALKETGFTFKELDKLEDCGGTKDDLLQYLKKWLADLKMQQPEVRIKTVYVSVPVSITEQVKELIEN